MYIIGTSGHIDHGKTSLIRALTGIDTDRLPEEKAREMTIDIGFARIDYPKFGTVGIIDVPGHERFIRNMVVGAWGIDLALLVIAVDDGWMPQTEDHFRVLSLLGIERIIVVLNKIDLADEEMAGMVLLEVREKLQDTRYADPPIVKVSAKTGEGVEALREIILENLRLLSQAPDARKPYLFVDRVFGSKGLGTVVTGTLRNGRFREEETILLLPQKTEARIKKIESHNQAETEGTPSRRTALNLSGVALEEVKRGDIIVKENFFTESEDILARLQLLQKGREIKNNLGVEILIGTTALKGKVIMVNEERRKDPFFPARIRFERPWFFYPGEPFILTHPGGYRIIGGGRVIWPRFENLRDRKQLKKSLPLLREYTSEEIITFVLKVNRSLPWEELAARSPESEKYLLRTLNSLVDRQVVVLRGALLFDRDYYLEAVTKMEEAIRRTPGLNITELSHHTGIEAEICRTLIPEVLKENKIVEKDGRYFGGDAITPENLPDDKKKALFHVLAQGLDGIELDRLTDEALRNNVRDLLRLGFLIVLEGNIVYHRDVYESLKEKIMFLFHGHDKITIPQAKEATNLSRKFIIPLLNRIEGDGLIKRIGDFRMKS